MDASEQVILARVRTLLALERNYLSEERTALAKFRTGLTLALVGPPASAVVAQLFSVIQIDGSSLIELINYRLLSFELFIFTFFATITLIGVWMTLRSNRELKKIGKKKKSLKDRQVDVLKCSKNVYELLGDQIDFDV